MSSEKNNFSSPFVSGNPIYKAAISQKFSDEQIQFGPVTDVLELLYHNVAFGNFFFLIIDWRTFTYPYVSANSFDVLGYTAEEMTNLEWLTSIVDPKQLDTFNDYGLKVVKYLTLLPAEKKKRVTLNHCLRVMHGKRREYVWVYQQHQMSYVDRNGALVYSITVITDVTHLHGDAEQPTWSITEKMDDGTYRYLIGSDIQTGSRRAVLTVRELDVLNLCVRGFNSREIAQKLGIQTVTVNSHKKKVVAKARCKYIAEAVGYAISNGYL